MFNHNVYFWLKDDLDENDLAAFEQGLQALCENTTATSGYYGKPVETDRDVVDSSYSYGLILFFDDAAGQDAYQVGDVHQKFLADHASKWERVLVYDTLIE
jgi:hypothetical protein